MEEDSAMFSAAAVDAPQALNTAPMETDARQVLDIAPRTTSVETGAAVKSKWIEVKRVTSIIRLSLRIRRQDTRQHAITHLERFYEVQTADLRNHNHNIMIEGQMIDQILAFEKQLKNVVSTSRPPSIQVPRRRDLPPRRRLVTQVEERRAASEDQLRSHKKAVSDKSKELLAMRAKQPQPTSLGQASAEPEFSQNRWFINQGKRASRYRVIENSSTRIPVIPVHPAPLPSAMTAESEGAVRPLDGGKNQSSIENAIVEA
ncbi:hypothetical protein B0H10DRAFT_1944036 [Mycena sp. CBHHK59/15]|nr:hypothetical protein B0H10DRAFT_1944036 [Mycena sp. CBHHK59/15]